MQRNHVRDYLDVAALADRMDISEAGAVLEAIDEYYDDRSADDESVVTALVPRLADPAPRDHRTLTDLPRYKGLVARWHDWAETRRVCSDLAQAMLSGTRHV